MNGFVLFSFALLGAAALALLWREGLTRSGRKLAASAAVLALALGIRLVCMDYETLDYRDFLTRWVAYFAENGGFRALSENVGNYNVPYLYVLAFFSYLGVRDLYLIKLFSIFFDFVLAFFSMRIVGLLTDSPAKRTAAFFLPLFLPTVVLNGALWGQCDSVYTAFAVMGVYYGLRRRSVPAFAAIALSFAFKLQAVFVMPVFLVLLYSGRIKWRWVFVAPLTYILSVVPAVIAGRSFFDTLLLYFNQAGSVGSGLNYNSPSVYSLFQAPANEAAAAKIGIVLAFLFMSAVLFALYLRRKNLSDLAIVACAALLSIGIPLLLPHMHDRYFFLADVFTLIFAVALPAFAPVPVLASFASLLGYHAYLKMKFLLPMSYGCVALIAAAAALALYLALESGLKKFKNSY